MPPIFLPFLAELNISESFETNFFFKKVSLVFAFDTSNISNEKICDVLELSNSAGNGKKSVVGRRWRSSAVGAVPAPLPPFF